MIIEGCTKIVPISPAEVEKAKSDSIPDIIIDTFNKLIVKNYYPASKESVVKQNEVLSIVCGDTDCGKLSKDEVFANHWLDVEEMYRDKGWVVKYVKYDRPACDAYFVFSILEH